MIRRRAGAWIALLGLWVGLNLVCQAKTPEGYTFYVAPHSHIDVEWYWTYDQTSVMSIKIMSQALAMMRKDPRFTFTQDQMMAIKPFWESLDGNDRAFLLRMVREGRFEIASGMSLQPDEAESDFEALTRQYYPALFWMESTFATKIKTVWISTRTGIRFRCRSSTVRRV
jgi:alpha-mannosidase